MNPFVSFSSPSYIKLFHQSSFSRSKLLSTGFRRKEAWELGCAMFTILTLSLGGVFWNLKQCVNYGTFWLMMRCLVWCLKKMPKTDTLDTLDDDMKHSPNVLWKYSEPTLNILWTYSETCSEPALNLRWTCSEPALNLLWTCCEPALNLLQTCIQPAVNLPWTCSEPALNLLWTYSEPTLNLLWTYAKYTLNILWTYTKHTLKICPRFNNIAKTLVTHSLSNMDPRDASASKNFPSWCL